MRERLSAILESLKDPKNQNQIFGGKSMGNHVTMEFNTDSGEVTLSSNDEKVVFDSAQGVVKTDKVEELASSSNTLARSAVQTQWDDLEAQRDLAFKIVYFFIGFICLTFGLLYVYYRMHQADLREEKERKRAGSGSQNEEAFFDFLVGHMDYDLPAPDTKNANPYLAKESGFGARDLEDLAH